MLLHIKFVYLSNVNSEIMKKKYNLKPFLFLLALILVTFSSCKKCYLCKCSLFIEKACDQEDIETWEAVGCDCSEEW